MWVYIGTSGLKNAYIGIPFPDSIVLDKDSISLTTVWQTYQLTATIEPTVSDKTIIWTTSNSTIATVSTTGLVTCVTPWECTITATTANGLTATCDVKKSLLPNTYQEVQYIQSSNWQYINTWLTGSWTWELEIKWSTLTSRATTYEMYFGGASWTTGCPKVFWQNYWSWKWVMLQQTPTWQTNFFQNMVDQARVLKLTTSTGVELDGVKLKDYTPWAWGNGNFWLFNNSWESSYYSSMKLYYFKAWSSWTLVREMIPCYRKSDSVIWLYDIVNDVFYTNSGSWTFTKWPNV